MSMATSSRQVTLAKETLSNQRLSKLHQLVHQMSLFCVNTFALLKSFIPRHRDLHGPHGRFGLLAPQHHQNFHLILAR